MRYVTLLLSGVPQNVPLINLSYNLDRLFDTDEIGTFKLRNLPNRHGKRLIALDFSSGFDAIAAQERLDGYHYELSNGCEYTLYAKITRKREFLRRRSPSPECQPRNEGWTAMTLVPTVSDEVIFRANAKLDAQLELLRKQKLVFQTEREVLREKKKLKQEYSTESIIESDEEATTPKRRCRSRSREISCSRERSNSRELTLYTKSSGSKEVKSRETELLALKSSSVESGSKLGERKTIERDKSKITESDNIKITESDNSKITESDNSKITESDNSKITESDNSKITESDNSKITESDNSKITESDNSKIAESDNSKITKSDNSKITKSDENATAKSISKNEVIEIFDEPLNEDSCKNTACSCGEVNDIRVPIAVINLTLDNGKHNEKRQLPKRPQFVLVVKRLLKQMEQSINKAEKKGKQPFPMFQFKNLLRCILNKSTVMGKDCMRTGQIIKNFREKHPKDKDDEFVEKAVEQIKTGRYGAYIEQIEDSEEDDVLLIEKQYDVVTVVDSDDEHDDLLIKLNNYTNEEAIKSELLPIKREEAEATLQSQDKTEQSIDVKSNQGPLVTGEAPQVKTNNSKSKEFIIKEEVIANTEITPIIELPSLPNLTEQCVVIGAKAYRTETVSNDVSNNNETLVESTNEEIKTEPTDVAVEHLLDTLKDIDGLDTDTTETETPQVTSITIMTSYSELFSLKYDHNKNNSTRINEIKYENVENNNETNKGNIVINNSNEETEGSLLEKINETLSKDSEITAPVIEDINYVIKNEPQEEEETIESIIKYVEFICSDLPH